ncbi:hypothetical protein BDR26DRAFT_858729 [Obelidium mucronatum]|nr:hypothetical protein BDR26DRAFT_858729 [Obelidium mucronatum]
MTNKGATSLMVRVVQVVRDSMLGPSQNTGKVTKPVIAKTQDTAAATEPFSSTASSARDDGDDKIDGAKETAFDNPKLPSKTAAAQPDQTLPSTPANDPSATNGPASSIPVPHDVLGDIIQILTSHFLPANLFKSKRTTAPVSSTNTPYTASPPHQSPLAKALTEIETRTHNENVSPTDTSNNDPESARAGGEVETWSHAPPARDPESPLSGSPSSLENKESSGAETDDAAATDLVNILRAIWSNEKDSESLQAREQMVKLLESVEVLYMFGEHFLDDEETPGRGNLEIALDLGLKFIQRFIDEPIGPLKTHLSQVLPLFAINVLPKHGPCILNTLQCLQDAFSSPNLALNHPEKLHALASDFRAMVATLYEIPLPQSENKNQFLSNDSVGHEIELVSEWVYAVWEHVEKDDFVLGLSKDGAEWWNALFVDEKGAVAVKISLWRDFTKLVLPSLLVDFKTLTIPHLSYFDETIRFELENVVVDVEATLPNLCQLKVENGVLFGFNNDVDVEYTHGVAIKFFQIHLQMIEIPFKAHRSGFMKMSDEGLMDVTITNRGISVSVQLEIDSATDNPKTMVVNTVNVDIQDMQLKIYGTKNDTAYHALEATIAARVAEALKESIQMELKAVIEKWDGPMTKVKRMYAV